MPGTAEKLNASLSVSPVRMRSACSTSITKILPSPIWPVLAAPAMASTPGRRDRRHHDLDLDLGQEVHGVFGAAIDLGVALLAAEPLDLGDGHARDASSVSASRTSSSLKGLMMAVMSFMMPPAHSRCLRCRQHNQD